MKLFKPYVSSQAIKNVVTTLKSGYIAEGEQVKLFEQEFAKKFGFKNALALNSGTSALELAYDLAGLKKGDEVIVPVLTMPATNIPLVRRGVKIVFADIDYDLNVRPEDIQSKITKKTKAIVFVHFTGNNRGLKQVLKLAKKKGIIVIEDSAQAVGSDYWGKADFTAVSFQAIKTLTTGDGGMLICKRNKDHEKGKRLRWFGFDRSNRQGSDITEAGYKYHMNDISASIGRGNLTEIDVIIEHRKKLAKIYSEYGLKAGAWLCAGFGDYLKAKEVFKENGIDIGCHDVRNDKYTLFKKYASYCPFMDSLEGNYFFVPYHHGISEKDAHKIGKLYLSI
jgi:perosamine synthetase